MRRTIFALLLAATLATTVPVAARAADAAAAAAARDLIQTMDLQSMIDKMLGVLTPMIVQQVKAENPEIPDEILTVISQEFMTALKEDYATFEKGAVAVYTSHFTADELRDVAAFYRTPTGRKTLEKMPLVTQQSMVLGQKWAQASMPRAIERVKRRLAEMGYKN